MIYVGKKPMEHIRLQVKKGKIDIFFKLLNHGFRVKVSVGCSIRELLCGEFGLEKDYLDHRIKTIFLNGKAVDNVDSIFVYDNAVLALSAAMPGLVGATMRKDGYYASMRNQISYAQSKQHGENVSGMVTLKLFNMVAVELGALFLKAGIWIRGEDFSNLLSTHGEKLSVAFVSGIQNDQEVSWSQLFKADWHKKDILLQVE
jgi:hypothetical protein